MMDYLRSGAVILRPSGPRGRRGPPFTRLATRAPVLKPAPPSSRRRVASAFPSSSVASMRHEGVIVLLRSFALVRPTGAPPRRPPLRFWSTSRARGPFRSLWSCRKAVERWVGAAGLETALNPDWAVGKKRSLGAARRARL